MFFEAVDGVRKDADARRAREKKNSARQRKGMTYSIPAGIRREEPVCHYPEGYSPGRKNWIFVDSDESARDTAIYLTLIGLAKSEHSHPV